jgi:hypothetical protein
MTIACRGIRHATCLFYREVAADRLGGECLMQFTSGNRVPKMKSMIDILSNKCPQYSIIIYF